MTVEEICAEIEKLTGNPAWVGTNYGAWNGRSFVGYLCHIEMRGGILMAPGSTELEAATEGLEEVKKRCA